MKQIMISYAFRVIRLIIIALGISYFIGTLWYIFVWQIYPNDPSEDDDYFFSKARLNVMKDKNEDLERYSEFFLTSNFPL